MVELPDDAIEAAIQAVRAAPDDTNFTIADVVAVAVRAAEPVIAAAVRAEAVAGERQRWERLVQAHLSPEGVGGADQAARNSVLRKVLAAGSVPVATPPRPEIVVLCGSTRFKDAFREAARENALAGRIVLTVSDLDPRPEVRHVNVPIDAETKARLDELHKRKIDLADRVLVLNVGGYVGESTRSEIEYATAHGKPISYLESGPRLQPERVGFGTDAFEAGGSLPGQPLPTPTEPVLAEDDFIDTARRVLAERGIEVARSDVGRVYDELRKRAASLVPAGQPSGDREAFGRRVGEEGAQAELLGHRLAVGGVTPGHPEAERHGFCSGGYVVPDGSGGSCEHGVIGPHPITAEQPGQL